MITQTFYTMPLLMQKDYTAFLDVNADLSDRIRKLLPQVQVFFFVCKPVKNKTGHRGTHPPQSAAYSAWYSKKNGRKIVLPVFLMQEFSAFARVHCRFSGEIKKKLHPTADKSRRCEKASLPSELDEFLLNVRASDLYHITDPGGGYNEYRTQIIRI